MDDGLTPIAARDRLVRKALDGGQWTPELILAQYFLSTWVLGARFGSNGQPGPDYEMDTARAALRDLAEHGYSIERIPSEVAALPSDQVTP